MIQYFTTPRKIGCRKYCRKKEKLVTKNVFYWSKILPTEAHLTLYQTTKF